jgi:hypothetical protein
VRRLYDEGRESYGRLTPSLLSQIDGALATFLLLLEQLTETCEELYIFSQSRERRDWSGSKLTSSTSKNGCPIVTEGLKAYRVTGMRGSPGT